MQNRDAGVEVRSPASDVVSVRPEADWIHRNRCRRRSCTTELPQHIKDLERSSLSRGASPQARNLAAALDGRLPSEGAYSRRCRVASEGCIGLEDA